MGYFYFYFLLIVIVCFYVLHSLRNKTIIICKSAPLPFTCSMRVSVCAEWRSRSSWSWVWRSLRARWRTRESTSSVSTTSTARWRPPLRSTCSSRRHTSPRHPPTNRCVAVINIQVRAGLRSADPLVARTALRFGERTFSVAVEQPADEDTLYQQRMQQPLITNLRRSLSTRADRQSVDILVTVCLCFLFVCSCVCTVTDFSAEDKASGVKFCSAVRRRPRQEISHFAELCSHRSPKFGQIGQRSLVVM